jgi:hypothetical protein
MTKPRKSLDELDLEKHGQEDIKPEVKPKIPAKTSRKKESAMDKILTVATKESTIRFTVDMPESMHRRLSLLAARTNKKKSEIVRLLLEEALQQVKD